MSTDQNEPSLSKPRKRLLSSISNVNRSSSRTAVLNMTPIFEIGQSCLRELVKDKKLDQLKELGGVEGIASALQTDTKKGIQGDDEDIANRRKAFGDNISKKPPTKGFFQFMRETPKKTAIRYTFGLAIFGWATLSLSYGNKVQIGMTFVPVLFATAVPSFIATSTVVNLRKYRRLCKVINKIEIEVVRSGRLCQISIYSIVVGDVIRLKIGDHVPADGLFLDGHCLQVEESSMTGESSLVEVSLQNPFLIYGAKVNYGHADMLVTSVDTSTTWDEMMGSDNDEQTPLQTRLDTLTKNIRKVGSMVAFLVLVALLAWYFTGNTTDDNGVREFNGSKTEIGSILKSVDNIIETAVTITMAATPDGLSLSVMLIVMCYFSGQNNVWAFNSKTKKGDIRNALIKIILAAGNIVVLKYLPLVVVLIINYTGNKILDKKNIIRKLSACETIGSATTICTDKTGTLTMNQMKVTNFWLGQEDMDQSNLSEISPLVLQLMHQGVAFNTTGSVCNGSKLEFLGSPTEKAILSCAVLDLGMDMEEMKQLYEIIHVEPFNCEDKRSGVLIRKKGEETICHVHWKGAAEMVLAMCSRYYNAASGNWRHLDDPKRVEFTKTIEAMSAKSLRCIAFAHAQVSRNQNAGGAVSEEERIKDENMTLLGIFGLSNLCRPGVREAIEDCLRAGVNIKMITGDNIFTASTIATECGILHDMSGAVIEGAEFMNYTPEERMEKVDNICVMARSSPFHKILMVQCLKQKGRVVAAIGDATNDAPALKEADIGLFMGIQDTQVAEESSDIVILNDSFCSVPPVLRCGRRVYNNIQKLIQFQLTFTIAAITVNFVAAVSIGTVPLAREQLTWVNLIIKTLGALALAMEQPTKELMGRPPVAGQTEPLITNIMWRDLLAQAFYQISILLTLLFRGKSIFNVDVKVRDTLIFNTLMLCTMFNIFNVTKMEKKKIAILAIVGFSIALQVVMIEFLNTFVNAEILNWAQWGACIGMAAILWPVGWIAKRIPVPETPILSYLRQIKNRMSIRGEEEAEMQDMISLREEEEQEGMQVMISFREDEDEDEDEEGKTALIK